MRSYPMKKGFSLLEMIIYVAILTLIMFVLVNTALGISSSYKQLRAAKNLESNGAIAMERITREIRGSDSVDTGQSTLGSHPGRLTLNVSTSTPTTVEFYLQSGILKLKKGGVYAGPLTASSTSITNLVFRNIGVGTSTAIKIEMTMESTVGTSTKTGSFYSTAILRGSYQ